MIRTAPEGRWFIVGAWVIAILLFVTAARSDSVVWWVVAAAWLAIAIWVIAFFRDPERAWSISERDGSGTGRRQGREHRRDR